MGCLFDSSKGSVRWLREIPIVALRAAKKDGSLVAFIVQVPDAVQYFL